MEGKRNSFGGKKKNHTSYYSSLEAIIVPLEDIKNMYFSMVEFNKIPLRSVPMQNSTAVSRIK